MRFIFALFLNFFSSMSFAQYPERAELNKIITEIIVPIQKGAIDQVIARTVFPFSVGDTDYTVKTFRANFSTIFIDGYAACLLNPENYQVALPGDDDWCLAVCMTAPEGFEAVVFSFVKQNGSWKLKLIDLQAK